jgi:hypothetical protein
VSAESCIPKASKIFSFKFTKLAICLSRGGEGKASSNEQESYKALEVQNGLETRVLPPWLVDDLAPSFVF